jgi:FkbM family methyltransferase
MTSTYLNEVFTKNILKSEITTIFELGSRDLEDALLLFNYYNCDIYAFECNPDCLNICKNNILNFNENSKKHIKLVENAISLEDKDVSFYPFDLNKYNNMGASSMFKIDFTNRHISDPDYNRENPQKEIIVKGKRLDTFINENNIKNVDLLCIDLQGYELNALKSLGDKISNVKYIITECSIQNTYVGGASFVELNDYLKLNNFKYVSSNKFHESFPDISLTNFSEFDALFINTNLINHS